MFVRLKRWLDFKRRNIKAWKPCNIYPSARIGNDVSIGRFAEVGNNVRIGSNTRIGTGAFIPEGVCIGDNCFIGPHAVFSNDMYPPSSKSNWQKTVVCNGAAIGAGACIRPGVVIGRNAMVGMGAVVTKHVPDGERWAGVPAKKIGDNNVC